MKTCFILAFLAVFCFSGSTFAADNAAAAATSDAIKPFDSHSSYCCYRIKKELNSRIDQLSANTNTYFYEVRANIRKSQEKIAKLEKELKEREDIDFEDVQEEVSELTKYVGEMEDQIKDLASLDKRQHGHVVKELGRVEDRVEDLEKSVQAKWKELETEGVHIAAKLVDVEAEADVNKNRIEEAAQERHAQGEALERLEGTVKHVGKEVMKGFVDVDDKLVNLTGTFENQVVAQGNEILGINREIKEIESLIEWVDADIQKNTKNIDYLVGNVTRGFDAVKDVTTKQASELIRLRGSQTVLEQIVIDLDNETVGLSKDVSTHAHAIGQLVSSLANNVVKTGDNAKEILKIVGDVGDVGEVAKKNAAALANLEAEISTDESAGKESEKAIAANAAKLEALDAALAKTGEEVKANAAAAAMLEDSIAALKQTLDSHRDSVVAEMKKLTAAIASDKRF